MYQQSSNYRRTKYGLIQKIYKKQVEKSKEREIMDYLNTPYMNSENGCSLRTSTTTFTQNG